MDPGQRAAIVELPHGTYPARLDDKGRIKLPVAFQKYMESLPEKKLFVTSLDRSTARIYPIAVWRENQNFIDGFTEEPQAAEDILLLANDLGADTEMDAQGRVLMHPDLRRALNIENSPVKLVPVRGRIDVYGEAEYEERKRRALEGHQEKLLLLQRKGFR